MQLVSLTEHLAADMAKESLEGRTFTLKLKLSSFEVHTRAVTLSRHGSAMGDLLPSLRKLLQAEQPCEIRLLGVRASGLRKKEAAGGRGRNALERMIMQAAAAGGVSDGEGEGVGAVGEAAAAAGNGAAVGSYDAGFEEGGVAEATTAAGAVCKSGSEHHQEFTGAAPPAAGAGPAGSHDEVEQKEWQPKRRRLSPPAVQVASRPATSATAAAETSAVAEFEGMGGAMPEAAAAAAAVGEQAGGADLCRGTAGPSSSTGRNTSCQQQQQQQEGLQEQTQSLGGWAGCSDMACQHDQQQQQAEHKAQQQQQQQQEGSCGHGRQPSSSGGSGGSFGETRCRQQEQQHQQQQQSGKHWTCQVCTYAANPLRLLRCEMCETPKVGPSSYQQQQHLKPRQQQLGTGGVGRGKHIGQQQQIQTGRVKGKGSGGSGSSRLQRGAQQQQLLKWTSGAAGGGHRKPAAAVAAARAGSAAIANATVGGRAAFNHTMHLDERAHGTAAALCRIQTCGSCVIRENGWIC